MKSLVSIAVYGFGIEGSVMSMSYVFSDGSEQEVILQSPYCDDEEFVALARVISRAGIALEDDETKGLPLVLVEEGNAV